MSILLHIALFLFSLPLPFYWPAFPDDPQTTGDKVASVFEFSVCLSVYLSVLSKFSNLFLQYMAAVLQKNFPRMNTDVLASYTQNIAQGQKYDSRINAVYSGCLVLRVGGSRLVVGLIKFCDI